MLAATTAVAACSTPQGPIARRIGCGKKNEFGYEKAIFILKYFVNLRKFRFEMTIQNAFPSNLF